MPKPKTQEPEDDNIIEAGVGHNSLSPGALRDYCQRAEKIIEERKVLNADLAQVYAEAEIDGFDKKTVKYCVKVLAMEAEERDEQFQLRDAYLQALGLL
jgi:uncharacterized protein (UPF0335 family)